MAQEKGGGRFGQQGEDAILWRKPYRPGDARHFRPGDFGPVRSTRAGSVKPARTKAAAGVAAHIPAHRGGPVAPDRRRFSLLAAGLFFTRWLFVRLFFARVFFARLFFVCRLRSWSDYARIPAFPPNWLAWYDVHRRVLPWRAPAGKRADPYRVWLSEIMLQQTTVQAVAAYYRKFLERWPDVKALAAAKEADVLAAWAGLGYYARARNLHAAAKIVADKTGREISRHGRDLAGLAGDRRVHRRCRRRHCL